MNSVYFAKKALLIRRSLVRDQVEEPNDEPPDVQTSGGFVFLAGIFRLAFSTMPPWSGLACPRRSGSVPIESRVLPLSLKQTASDRTAVSGRRDFQKFHVRPSFAVTAADGRIP